MLVTDIIIALNRKDENGNYVMPDGEFDAIANVVKNRCKEMIYQKSNTNSAIAKPKSRNSFNVGQKVKVDMSGSTTRTGRQRSSQWENKEGTIVRLNPKRAKIKLSDGTLLNCPYSLMSEA